jgi:hypothetical protein
MIARPGDYQRSPHVFGSREAATRQNWAFQDQSGPSGWETEIEMHEIPTFDQEKETETIAAKTERKRKRSSTKEKAGSHHCSEPRFSLRQPAERGHYQATDVDIVPRLGGAGRQTVMLSDTE